MDSLPMTFIRTILIHIFLVAAQKVTLMLSGGLQDTYRHYGRQQGILVYMIIFAAVNLFKIQALMCQQ
jgi:hypothetical protein